MIYILNFKAHILLFITFSRGGDTQKKYFHFLICYTKWYVNEFKHGFMSVSLLETAILKNEIERKSINFNSMFGS